MTYCTGSHTKFYHRFHIVWITKYRYKVLYGICANGCVKLSGRPVLRWGRRSSRAFCRQVHMFVLIPPHLALYTVMQRIKGRSSRKIQMGLPDFKKRYWGRRFWGRGYFSTASGNVTDDVILVWLPPVKQEVYDFVVV